MNIEFRMNNNTVLKPRCTGLCYGTTICPYAKVIYDYLGHMTAIKCQLKTYISYWYEVKTCGCNYWGY